MKYTKIRGNNINQNTEIIVKNVKILNLEGISVFEVGQVGTIKHGKSKNNLTETSQGMIVKSQNNHKWAIQISNTGQVVTTDLGEET